MPKYCVLRELEYPHSDVRARLAAGEKLSREERRMVRPAIGEIVDDVPVDAVESLIADGVIECADSGANIVDQADKAAVEAAWQDLGREQDEEG